MFEVTTLQILQVAAVSAGIGGLLFTYLADLVRVPIARDTEERKVAAAYKHGWNDALKKIDAGELKGYQKEPGRL